MTSPEAEALGGKLAEMLVQLSGTEERPLSVPEMRGLYGLFADMTAEPDEVTWTEVDAGGIPAIWADHDAGATGRVVQYVHGGSYVIGNAHFYKRLTGHLATAVGCRVLSVDYRLAPEHPHPAAVEDSTTAYRWLLGQGNAPAQLAISGDSAGGGLTLATVLALRDAGTAQPAAAVPISPWADMEATGETITTNADHDALIHPPMLLAMAGMFLAGHDPQDPLVAPIHSDFMGIAPLYIQVGGHETLLDDAKLVAAAAQRDGVDVMLEVFPEMQHVFQIGAGNVPESDDAIAKIGVFLRPRLVSVGMPLSPGTRLGHYGVTALLGQEGMGQVWQVTDTELGREVALNARSTSCRDRGPSAVKLPGASTVACRARGLHVLTPLSGGLTTRRGLRYTDSYL